MEPSLRDLAALIESLQAEMIREADRNLPGYARAQSGQAPKDRIAPTVNGFFAEFIEALKGVVQPPFPEITPFPGMRPSRLAQQIQAVGEVQSIAARVIVEHLLKQQPLQPETMVQAIQRLVQSGAFTLAEAAAQQAQTREIAEEVAWGRLEMVAQVVREACVANDTPRLCEVVAVRVGQMLAADQSGVAIIDGDEVHAIVSRFAEDSETIEITPRRFQRKESLTDRISRSLQPAIAAVGVAKIGDCPEAELFALEAAESALIVPLEIKQEPLGIIWAVSSRPHWFSRRDLLVIDPITAQLASSLIAFHSGAQAKARELEALRVAARLNDVLQDTHHRIKNNLQTVAALLDVQAMAQTEPSLRKVLRELVLQVRTIASVHGFLTHDSGAQTLSFQALLERVVPMAIVETPIHVDLDLNDFNIPMRHATPLALVINELIENAATHGAKRVTVRAYAENRECFIEVHDTGPGFPPNFNPLRDAKLGLNLVNTLVHQHLRGEMNFVNDGGACAKLRFRLENPETEGAPPYVIEPETER